MAGAPTMCVTSYKLEELFDSTSWQVVTLSDTQNQQRQWSPDPPKSVSGQYAYQVSACGGGRCSSGFVYSPGVTITLPGSLAFPGGLKACQTNVTGTPRCENAGSLPLELWGNRYHGYRVSWNPVANATRYEYKILSSSATYWNPTESAPVSLTTTSVDGGGNPADSQFGGWFERTYSIRACNASTCSSWTSPPVTIHAEAFLMRAAITPTYYHTDALGSPVVETDASGQEIANSRRRYEPYGKTLSPSAQGPGYTGHVTDAMTGFSYMQQRYHDPLAGRFLSVDPVSVSPVNGLNFNRYWYANNSPYRFTDPDGRDAADRAYGAAVGFMLRNDPERLRIWAGGEAAATTEGSAAEACAGMGLAIGEFVDKGDYSKTAVAGVTVKAMVMLVTKGKGGTGHYTNTHQSGLKYHGKGNEARMKQSATEKAKANNDPVVDQKHTETSTSREAFKAEAKAIEADGGPGNGNYNKINSPGKKYLEPDKAGGT